MEPWRAELYHHGIKGQKWGVRNGPPYPLRAKDHSAAEKKTGWRKSLVSSPKAVTAQKRAMGVEHDSHRLHKGDISPRNSEWHLDGKVGNMSMNEFSSRTINRGKKATKKVLIATGIIAVSALTAYALYKHRDFSKGVQEEIAKQAQDELMRQYEAKRAAEQLRNRVAKGLEQRGADISINSLGRTYSSPKEFKAAIYELSHKTASQANELFDRHYWDGLTETQKEAVKLYSNEDGEYNYKLINRYLRFGEKSISEEKRERVGQLVRSCEEVLNGSVLKEDAFSIRGASSHSIQQLLSTTGLDISRLKAVDADKLIGATFTEDGFYSSSVEFNSAFKGIKINTILPKGTKAMYVAPVSAIKDESELLVQRGTTFQIKDFEVDPLGQLVGLTVEAIAQKPL